MSSIQHNEVQALEIQILEELALNASPCLQQILDNGWVLRLAAGYTRQANSVTPLYSGDYSDQDSNDQDLVAKIRRCEAIYHRHKLPPIFRLADTPRTVVLDQTLERLNYRQQDRVSVQVKDISNHSLGNNSLFPTIAYKLTEEWLDHFVHAAQVPVQHWQTLSTMLEIIPNPTCYAWLKDRHRFCSCAVGVLERNYLGIYWLVTAKRERQRGYGTQLLNAMLDWGKHHGATKAYVQVETKNLAAIDLYNKLGFSEVYQYFYRTKS